MSFSSDIVRRKGFKTQLSQALWVAQWWRIQPWYLIVWGFNSCGELRFVCCPVLVTIELDLSSILIVYRKQSNWFAKVRMKNQSSKKGLHLHLLQPNPDHQQEGHLLKYGHIILSLNQKQSLSLSLSLSLNLYYMVIQRYVTWFEVIKSIYFAANVTGLTSIIQTWSI